jgi:hypothetical protein
MEPIEILFVAFWAFYSALFFCDWIYGRWLERVTQTQNTPELPSHNDAGEEPEPYGLAYYDY